jgi:RNA polymerase sigma-70 factor (ECF subfamily)
MRPRDGDTIMEGIRVVARNQVDFPADGPTLVDMLQDSAAAKSVRHCIDALDGAQKQAIALAFYQGLSHAELAHHLREPLGTVKSWIRRGLERLKHCLERAGVAL